MEISNAFSGHEENLLTMSDCENDGDFEDMDDVAVEATARVRSLNLYWTTGPHCSGRSLTYPGVYAVRWGRNGDTRALRLV